MEKTANATRAEIIQKARDHYQEAADSLGHWSNSIPKALDAWEREPELIERIEELEKELFWALAIIQSYLPDKIADRAAEQYHKPALEILARHGLGLPARAALEGGNDARCNRHR